jgi:hypothetical protein
MSVDAPQPPESLSACSFPSEIGDEDAPRVPHDDAMDLAASLDKEPDLASDCCRDFDQEASRLPRDELVGRNLSPSKSFQPADLLGFQARQTTLNFMDMIDSFEKKP